jgi:hypothetical protein
MKLAICAALTFFSLSASAEQFLCTADKMTGFSYNATSKQWEPSQFRATHKYVISRSAKDQGYIFKRIGESLPDGDCAKNFNDSGYLFCSDHLEVDFKFNKKNKRYTASFLSGYDSVGIFPLTRTDADSSNVAIEIGTCSTF